MHIFLLFFVLLDVLCSCLDGSVLLVINARFESIHRGIHDEGLKDISPDCQHSVRALDGSGSCVAASQETRGGACTCHKEENGGCSCCSGCRGIGCVLCCLFVLFLVKQH